MYLKSLSAVSGVSSLYHAYNSDLVLAHLLPSTFTVHLNAALRGHCSEYLPSLACWNSQSVNTLTSQSSPFCLSAFLLSMTSWHLSPFVPRAFVLAALHSPQLVCLVHTQLFLGPHCTPQDSEPALLSSRCALGIVGFS